MKPEFLQKVKVVAFTKTHKIYGMVDVTSFYGHETPQDRNHRIMQRSPNLHPDDIFTVIGVKTLPLGFTDDLDTGERSGFVQTGSLQVYVVAKSIGRWFQAMAEDLIPVEDGNSKEDDPGDA